MAQNEGWDVLYVELLSNEMVEQSIMSDDILLLEEFPICTRILINIIVLSWCDMSIGRKHVDT